MATHSGCARSSDLASVKAALIANMPTVKLPHGDKVTIVKALTAERFNMKGSVYLGTKSTCTYRLLVSIEGRDEFDKDPLG